MICELSYSESCKTYGVSSEITLMWRTSLFMADATQFYVRKSKGFQDEKPCQLVNSYHRFGEALCLHIQGVSGSRGPWKWRQQALSKRRPMYTNVQCINSQKTGIFISTIVRNWNLECNLLAQSNGTHKQNMCTSLMCSCRTLGLQYTSHALRDSPFQQTSLSYRTLH